MKLGDLSAMELQFEVERLLYEYVQTLDDGHLERWPVFFTEECTYQVIARDNFDRGLPLALIRCESRDMLHDRVTALQQANVYGPRYLRHLVSNPRVVERHEESVLVQSNFAVLRTMLDEPTKIFLAGRYLDRIVVDSGVLRFSEKRCIYDTLLIPNSVTYPV